MIMINLLPHREERRQRRRTAFFVGLALAAVVGVGIVAGWYGVVQQMTAGQQERNRFLGVEIAKLEVQIKDIANLKAEIESLKARQRAVEDLQIDRNIPVHLLNELVRQTPEGIYVTSVKQDGQTLSVTGVAQTQERVSQFLRNTAYNSEWLVRPELIESKAATAQGVNREQKRLFDFSLRLTIKRPEDKVAPGAAPTGKLVPAASSSSQQPAMAIAPKKT